MDIPIQTQEGVDISAPGYGGNGRASHGGDIAINGPLEDHHRHLAAVSGPYNNITNGSSNGNYGNTGGNKVAVKYRECQKNHAAAMGGTATDGCGEFMPSGEEGTIEALTCSACSCHRNFHRKEVDGGGGPGHSPTELALDWYHSPATTQLNRIRRKVIMGHTTHKNIFSGHEPALLYPTGALIASRGPTPHQMILPYNMAAGSLPSESDEQYQEDDEHHHRPGGGIPTTVMTSARPTQMVPKKRFRTKFTPDQKEKMLCFAEKVGWKIQREEESVVQQFCQEVGVKRRVLKVWMHNNKQSLAKNISIPNVAGLNLSPTSMNVVSPNINDDNNNNMEI